MKKLLSGCFELTKDGHTTKQDAAGFAEINISPEGLIIIKRVVIEIVNVGNIFLIETGKKEKREDCKGGKKEKGGTQPLEPAVLSAAFIDKPDWRALFEGWLNWRRCELKKPLKTLRAMQAQYKRLWELSSGNILIAEAIILRSQEREWREFFPLPYQPATPDQNDLFAAKPDDWQTKEAARKAAINKMFGDKNGTR